MTAFATLPRRARIAGLSIWAAGGAVMFAAAVAMQMTSEVKWGPEDFAFAAIVFGLAGVATGAVLARPARGIVQLLALAAIAVTTALVWIEAAVGIFD